MKKISISVILIALLSIMFSLTSSAATPTYISGLFRYTVEDGEASIVGTILDLDTDDEDKVILSLEIPSSLDGYPVTSIGEQAFKDYSIVDITFPDTIKKLYKGAFYNCEGLFNVVLPDSIKLIDDCCFANCMGMLAVKLPSKLETLGCAAFYNTSITEIYIPSSLTNTALEYSIIGIGVGSRMGPFSLSKLTSITFEEGRQSIPKGLFYGCAFLEEVYIPDFITKINVAAFKDCLSLKTITGMKNVNCIKALSFANCIELASVPFLAKLETLESGAFYNTLKLKSFTVPKALVETNMDYSIVGIGVGTKIGAFENSGLENISFESGVETVPFGIFKNCSELKSINIPDSIIKIGACSFMECTGLESIIGMNNVETIKALAFEGCKSLTTMPFLKSLKILESGAFANTESLKNFTVPKSLSKCTMDYSFVGFGMGSKIGPFKNSGLTSISFENETTKIPFGLFSECNQLVDIHIPDSITSLKNCCFKGCVNLKRVTGMKNLTSISDLVFYNCGQLSDIPTLKNLKSVGAGAFAKTTALLDFKLDSNITSVNTFFSIGGIGTGTVYPFEESGVTKVIVSNNVTKLPAKLFYSSANINQVHLNNTVVQIGESTFNKCSGITDVYFYGTEEEWNAIAIKKNNDNLINAVIHFMGEHEHSYTASITKSPTCTEAGITTYTCSCGDIYTETIEPTGHDFDGSKCKNCDYDRADDCSCNCHKSGISGFFWKIINFFNKIFKLKEYCACGAKHW